MGPVASQLVEIQGIYQSPEFVFLQVDFGGASYGAFMRGRLIIIAGRIRVIYIHSFPLRRNPLAGHDALRKPINHMRRTEDVLSAPLGVRRTHKKLPAAPRYCIERPVDIKNDRQSVYSKTAASRG